MSNSSWYKETLKVLIALVIATALVWGISQAENSPLFEKPPVENLVGIYGVVSSISEKSIVLDNSKGSRYQGIDIYYADLSDLETIETNSDTPQRLSLADIQAGDKIIARGTVEGDKIEVYNIISFSFVGTTTVSTTTPDVLGESSTSTAATSSDSVATSSDSEGGTGETTLIENIIDGTIEIIENIIDAVSPDAEPETAPAATEPEVEVTPQAEEEPEVQEDPVEDEATEEAPAEEAAEEESAEEPTPSE